MERYIGAGIDYVERELQSVEEEKHAATIPLETSKAVSYPLEIDQSLRKFLRDHPHLDRNAFVMMKFGKTRMHETILQSKKTALNKYRINGLRSDDKEYHDDLFANVPTYLHGCAFGIAVFERLEADEFNPNVSLEVGYMRALRKSVCLLKDNTTQNVAY